MTEESQNKCWANTCKDCGESRPFKDIEIMAGIVRCRPGTGCKPIIIPDEERAHMLELASFVGVALPWYSDVEVPGHYTYDGDFVANTLAKNPFGDEVGWVLYDGNTSRYVTLDYAKKHYRLQ